MGFLLVFHLHLCQKDTLPCFFLHTIHHTTDLIRLGHKIFQARKPNCNVCPLTDLCEYYAMPDQGNLKKRSFHSAYVIERSYLPTSPVVPNL